MSLLICRHHYVYVISMSAAQIQSGVVTVRSKLFPRSDVVVAWPSGLRRWFKAPVISMAWVRIPPLPVFFFFHWVAQLSFWLTLLLCTAASIVFASPNPLSVYFTKTDDDSKLPLDCEQKFAIIEESLGTLFPLYLGGYTFDRQIKMS